MTSSLSFTSLLAPGFDVASYQYRYSLSTLACPTDLHAGEGGGAVLLDDTDDVRALAELRPGQTHSAAMAAEQEEQQI